MTKEELRYERSTMNCDKDTHDTKPVFIPFAHIKPSDFCDDMVSLDLLVCHLWTYHFGMQWTMSHDLLDFASISLHERRS